ncbi:hypothetical protein J2Y69_002285 [Microbacterium resistens]|uniref:Minor capsid protein n=1 Tax=Microbacterium resistens TaxID=156977 RepID=A0ABU1SDK0_9MICO|nr:hypothetical protein [Microbacterium resistens]MDR6867681.1 hypothetical protein [Microbacterium resistens]
MPRLKKRHLPHRVNIQILEGEGAEGEIWGPVITGVPAYVEQKARLRVDRRSTSPTSGQEITSSTFVVVLHENDMLPRSRVTVFPGEARERTSEVIDAAFYDYNAHTPNHSEIYLE